MKAKKKRVIPGFGLSMGVTITILSLVVLIPLAALVIYTSRMHLSDIIETITRPRVLASFNVTFLTSLIASIINSIMGVILAWVLVRYDFPFKRVLDGMIELPFALPTAVAGLALTNLTTEEGLIGKLFAPFGIKIAHTRIGIVVALIFYRHTVRCKSGTACDLKSLIRSYEEAAGALGANRGTIFRKVILPEIIPPALTGFGLALGRCIGEYGSVIFIAGNKPYETEITPLIIMSELQDFDYNSATAIALVMLAFLICNIVHCKSYSGEKHKNIKRRKIVCRKMKAVRLLNGY